MEIAIIMDHTYCTVAKTFPKRRDTYASRIEKLRAANGKDLSVTESLMVEAGAWLKVVIKDEDEEEEICHAVASEEEEEEDGESCRMVAGVAEEKCQSQTSPAAVQSPAGCVTQSPTHPLVLSPSEKTEKSEELSEMVEKHPDDSPSSDSPNYSPSLEKPLITEEENEEERGSSVINERLEEEEESESDEAYLERAAARIREFQMQLKKARTFSVEKFQDSAGEIQRHTGLPDYSTFLALYDFLRPKGSSQMQYWGSVFKGRQRVGGNELGRHRKLGPMDELFLTLIRLRRGLPRKDLAARFGVSESVVTRVFITWCNVMYERFRQLPIAWPCGELEAEEEGKATQEAGARGHRQHVLKTVPAAVKEAYLQAAAYLTQSDLPVGSEARTFDRPFNDDFMEFLEQYSTAENMQQDDEAEEEENLSRPEQSNRDADQDSP